MLTFLCPHCDTKIPAESRPIGSLPPTGGDYEWQEGDKTHTCPNCQNSFEMRVRTHIETGTLMFINKSPKPKKEDIVWYAVAAITNSRWAKAPEERLVYASAICQTEEEAIQKLHAHSQRHYEPLHLLKLTSEGYFDELGNKILEADYYADIINYLEIH
jgi:uncharacterized protein YlaI